MKVYNYNWSEARLALQEDSITAICESLAYPCPTIREKLTMLWENRRPEIRPYIKEVLTKFRNKKDMLKWAEQYQ